MRIGELLQRIQSLYSKGVQSDDTRLSRRHIYNKLLTVRGRLISQQVKKRQKISDWNFVILPCVELIQVPAHECSCLAELGCPVWRTKFPLPKPLTDLNKHLIEFVMSIENSMLIDETTREEVLYAKGNKYTFLKPKYLFENGYLYFPMKKSPKVVKIKFLPEDPIEAHKYPSICGDCEDCINCEDYSSLPFPIDGDMIEPLIEIAAEELVAKFSVSQQDIHNDARDNNAENRG